MTDTPTKPRKPRGPNKATREREEAIRMQAYADGRAKEREIADAETAANRAQAAEESGSATVITVIVLVAVFAVGMLIGVAMRGSCAH